MAWRPPSFCIPERFRMDGWRIPIATPAGVFAMSSPISPLEEARDLLKYYTRKEIRAGHYADILRNLIEIQESRILLDTAENSQFWEYDSVAGFLVDVHTAPECLRPFPENLKELLERIADPVERAATATWFRSRWAALPGTAATREIVIADVVTLWVAVVDTHCDRLIGTVKLSET